MKATSQDVIDAAQRVASQHRYLIPSAIMRLILQAAFDQAEIVAQPQKRP